MNIMDVESPTEYPNDIREAIYARQLELMHKYHGIEEKNGLLICGDIPVNLHDKMGQARLKDMAWRMTEELTEATIALVEDGDREHFVEELIDAFHFFVELSILCDFIPEDHPQDFYLKSPGQTTNGRIYAVIEAVGGAMNCLKNKPWKQTNMLTDIKKYYRYMDTAWWRFMEMFAYYDLDWKGVYDLYFRKSEVNKFRQRSNY